MSKSYYFGCHHGQKGHFYWEPGRRLHVHRANFPDSFPWKYVDACLTPKSTTKQGAAALHNQNGWTALAMHDYTVDSRGKSNSVFLFEAELDFPGALARATTLFPDIVKRIGTISLVSEL